MAKEIEVLYELKTPVAKAAEILAHLPLVGRKETVDVYYYDPLRGDLKPGKAGQLSRCFRLRSKGDHCFLTYKINVYRRDEWLYADEHETEVGDHQAAKAIVEHLGLKELVTVRMVKTIYRTDAYEIILEQVRGLGNFIEVESRQSVKTGHEETEKQCIREFVTGLGLKIGAESNLGKPEMMLGKKKGK
jgi:predicted adenylyl cyclase CyaB